MKYKINKFNIHKWENVLNEILNWTKEKNLFIFSFNSHIYSMHSQIFNQLQLLKYNKNFTKNIDFEYSGELKNNHFQYRSTLSDLSNFVENCDSNFIIVTHYVENITEDFIHVYNSNISKFINNKNKEILEVELHTSQFSDFKILDNITLINDSFVNKKSFVPNKIFELVK